MLSIQPILHIKCNFLPTTVNRISLEARTIKFSGLHGISYFPPQSHDCNFIFLFAWASN